MLAPDPQEIPISLDWVNTKLHMAACGGRDQVVRDLCNRGWEGYEKPLPKLIALLVGSTKSVFLDIGANTGYYSLLASAVGACSVRAFEPVPQICEVIKCNIRHSSHALGAPIEIYNIALSNHAGHANLYIPNPEHGLIETSASLSQTFKGSYSYSITVQVDTLDRHLSTFPLDKSCLIVAKLDVESLEPSVLLGGAGAIREYMPIIITEILPDVDTRFYVKWMQKYDYLHYSLDPLRGATLTSDVEASPVNRDHLFAHKSIDLKKLLSRL